jgi:tRNA-2-methylthio-N6-dimethylallyladenosine synthase
LESQVQFQVPEAVKAERLARLQDLLNANTLDFNNRAIGKVYPVLFDRIGKTAGQLVGRSPYMQAVTVKAEQHLLHTVQNVRIIKAGPSNLHGELAVNMQKAKA